MTINSQFVYVCPNILEMASSEPSMRKIDVVSSVFNALRESDNKADRELAGKIGAQFTRLMMMQRALLQQIHKQSPETKRNLEELQKAFPEMFDL